MIRGFCFIISFLLITLFSYPQTPKLVQFPSPEATNMGIVGAVPVTLHTGRASVNIPVFEGDGKTISPISLSYNTGGIMPDFHPGWTGLNWTLNAGGVVTRTMNFIPDETADIGYFYKYSLVNSIVYYDPAAYFGGSSCWGDVCTIADGAADEFYVTAPGLSGKFQLNDQGKFQMIEDPSVLVEVEGNNAYDPGWGLVDLANKPFKGFTITKNDGTKYRFGYAPELIETIHPITSTPDPNVQGVASGWYLAQIIYPTNETVNYTYTGKVMDLTPSGNDVNIHSYLFDDQYGGELPLTDGRSSVYGDPGINHTATNHAYLKSIESNRVRLDFNTSTSNELKNGTDDQGRWKKLDNIVVTNKLSGKVDKTIVFTYDPSPKKRLTLLSVATQNANNESLPPYQFTYDANPLPPYQSGQLDFWGYFNNTPYTSMLPSAAWPGTSGPFYYSPNREPDIHYVANGILKQIKYPTGGTVSFEYEPNDYSWFREFTTNSNPSPLLQVQWGWEQQRYYNIDDQNYWNDYPTQAYLYYGSSPLTLTGYANATIKGSGIGQANVYQMLTPGTYTAQSIQQLLGITYNQGNSYTITYLDLVPRKKALGPGLRIKRIVHKNEDNIEMVHEYVYSKNYMQPGYDQDVSSGILGSRGAFIAGASRSGNPGVSYSSPQSPEILTDGGPIGYSEVVDITKDKDGNTLGYVINKYSNFDTNPDDLPGVQGPNAMWIAKKNTKYYERGKLVETATYSSSGNVLTRTVNEYHPQIYTVTNGFTAKPDLLYGNPLCTNCQKFIIYYKDYFGASLLVGQTQMIYSQTGSDVVQTTTATDYNNYQLPQETRTTTSTGQNVKQTYTYPFNLSASLYTSMVRKNMVGYPIETITYKNNKITAGELNTYRSAASGSDFIIVKDNSYKLAVPTPSGGFTPYTGNAVSSDYQSPLLQFTNYDSKGHLLEAKDRQGIITSYLWGYSSEYPVAKVVGRDYNTIKSYVDQNILDNPGGVYSDAQIQTELNKIRTGLAGTNAQVNTYTYSPQHGISSEVDASGKTSYYEYDGFGRLSVVRDRDRNVIRKYCYNYAGQPENCQ